MLTGMDQRLLCVDSVICLKSREISSEMFCVLHCVPKKTCDYLFYNNFNNKCPITIIFGIVSSKSMTHRKLVSLSHLTYLVQLPYLGRSQNTKKWPISF